MGFLGRKCSARTMKNDFKVEGEVPWLEGTNIEEAGPKIVTITRVKTVPELDIAFGLCEVSRVNEGVGVIYERLVVL